MRRIVSCVIASTTVCVLACSPGVATAFQPAEPAPGAGAPARPSPVERGTSRKADREEAAKSMLAEDGPVATDRDAQSQSIVRAVIRLPLAAVLSAVLAFRPRRRGTPPRKAPVIQTQIILAIVGSVVMLVVGVSLARAFGIVGAAGLIRYRAKVDDPKDAGVMLSTLAVGLASGVGLYALAVFATFFIVGVLWIIESIDPEPFKLFSLTVTADKCEDLKDSIERILGLRHIAFELRSISPTELRYEVKLPLPAKTDKISEALIALRRDAIDVKWEQQKESK